MASGHWHWTPGSKRDRLRVCVSCGDGTSGTERRGKLPKACLSARRDWGRAAESYSSLQATLPLTGEKVDEISTGPVVLQGTKSRERKVGNAVSYLESL